MQIFFVSIAIEDPVTIERMFSKMQNCTSLGRVGFFLRERQGNFCQKNLHLFSCLRTMFWSYETLPECKNAYPCTSCITSVICCLLTMVLKCPSVSLCVGMQNTKRQANHVMFKNRVICNLRGNLCGYANIHHYALKKDAILQCMQNSSKWLISYLHVKTWLLYPLL